MVRKTKNKSKAQYIWTGLQEMYPDAACTLDSGADPFHLFVRGILSAQCTDKRVNAVTETLFQEYPDMQAFAVANEDELGEKIKSCGLYRAKAKGIIHSAQMLINEYNGVIPDCPETLEKFPSVGRKIANLIAGEVYGIPAIVVDTHCIRVSFRLGLTESHTPAKIEKDLMQAFPEEQWIAIGHLMVAHGRSRCMAKKTDCANCLIWENCVYGRTVISS